MRIALAGNPNSGKTTLFNAITGKVEKVGNWAGVTVEKKEGSIKQHFLNGSDSMVVVDLPGAYSMSPFTSEENITRTFVQDENPEAIINIVDATNLSRSLFFTTQLLEVGVPVIVALNKSDLNLKKNITIDLKKLSEKLGCPVVSTTATKSNDNGLQELISAVISAKGKEQTAPFRQEAQITNKEDAKTYDLARYEFVNAIVAEVEQRKQAYNKKSMQDTADQLLANKYLGIPIFALVMWAVFYISQTTLGTFIADFLVGYIDMFYEWAGEALGEGVSPFAEALLLDGIIGGVGAVVGFLPLIMVMFFLLALLEDCGYMARVAVVMDRYMQVVGLSGKSIIPMIIGTGCAIPGVMATRTIRNERQRRTTAMLTPFMPCGAKLPVIALFAGVFFADQPWVGTSMYFMGIGLIVLGAFLIKRISGHRDAQTFFIMELPEYQFPSIGRALVSMFARGKAFLIKAATVILVCNALVHIMQTFDWSFSVVAEGAEGTSILASVAGPFALVLLPLGFGVWQLAAAAITGFIAKENVVGTLAVVYGITNFIDTEELALMDGATTVAQTMGMTQVAALAYLMFNLFTPPCFAAIGAMNAEMENKKWLFAGIGLQFGTAFVVSFFIYQVGTLLTLGTVGTAFIPGLIVVAALLGYLGYLVKKGDVASAQAYKAAVAQ